MLLLFVSTNAISQNIIQPEASIIIKSSEQLKPILNYLFNTYGIEDSERILLNIHNYELENNVKVLFENQYTEEIQKIDAALATKKTTEEYIRTAQYKAQIINFSQIESIVN